MDADRDTYRFSFGPSATELERLADGETRYLSTEVAGGFTGVYFAIYATGNGEPCAGPADFDWFDHRVTADRAHSPEAPGATGSAHSRNTGFAPS
jgi:alpha-N-arabinofuranosidase